MISKKFIFLLLVCAGVGSFVASVNSRKSVDIITGDLNTSCDLNTKNCNLSFKNQKLTLTLLPRPITPMAPTTLRIFGLKGEFKGLKVQIQGTNMAMGVIKENLIKRGDVYECVVVFSSCVISPMNYAIGLYDGDMPLGVWINLELKE